MPQTAQQRLVMAKVKAAQQNGFTGYSVSLRRKVKVSPSDRIEVKKTRMRNGNESVMVMGHIHHQGKIIKIPRIIGQYKP